MSESEQRPDWDAVRERMASGEWFDVVVTSANRGGLLTLVDGISSYVPLSQLVSEAGRDEGELSIGILLGMVGSTLRVRVIEANERRNRVFLTERAAEGQPSE